MHCKDNKKYLFFVVEMAVAAVLVLVDQLIKSAVVKTLKGQSDIVIIKNFLGLTYAENTGAAFSSFSESTTMLSIVTLILLIGFAIYMFLGKLNGKIKNVCAVCIISGGTGNLIDRFKQGFVVDYIETLFVDFPVFNFADMLVVCGVIVLCAVLIYEIVAEEKQKKQENNNGNS